MATIDLDARRAERAAKREAEAETSPPTVLFGGKEFTLPRHMPAELLFAIGELQDGRVAGLKEACLSLLGSEQFVEFRAVQPPLEDEDINDFIEMASNIYGETTGNSEASPSSSESTGSPQSQTSDDSTESTSATSGEAA